MTNKTQQNWTHTNPTISPKSEPNKSQQNQIHTNPATSSKSEPNWNQNQTHATTPPSQDPHHCACITGPTKLHHQ